MNNFKRIKDEEQFREELFKKEDIQDIWNRIKELYVTEDGEILIKWKTKVKRIFKK